MSAEPEEKPKENALEAGKSDGLEALAKREQVVQAALAQFIDLYEYAKSMEFTVMVQEDGTEIVYPNSKEGKVKRMQMMQLLGEFKDEPLFQDYLKKIERESSAKKSDEASRKAVAEVKRDLEFEQRLYEHRANQAGDSAKKEEQPAEEPKWWQV